MINRYAKPLILLVALASIAMLAVGLYLQLVLDMLPCPLCIMQRYAFMKVAVLCLIALALPGKGMRIVAGLGSLAALGGAGIAIRHLWVKAHPTVSCGIDPLETMLNKLPFDMTATSIGIFTCALLPAFLSRATRFIFPLVWQKLPVVVDKLNAAMSLEAWVIWMLVSNT